MDLGFRRVKFGERVRRRRRKEVYVGRKREEEGGAQDEHMIIDYFLFERDLGIRALDLRWELGREKCRNL